MSKILNDEQRKNFICEFLKEEKNVFSIILSIDEEIVHCYINGDKKIDFKKNDVISFL